MLSFDLTALESHAVIVDGCLDARDGVWGDTEPKPSGDIRVTGRLSSAGASRFYFSGRMEGSVSTDCRRCLTPVTASVAEDVHLLFVRAGDREMDDPDVYVIEGRARELDLRPAIREEWLLAVPALVVCRDDCKGLCPHCGADLNAGPCGCESVRDERWDALRKARTTS
ncbi:MAG: hypothetical protein MNPFHGCM_01062 [Gemmatimonadaceae bacterium]|nr:hypothetical protein [Gemmatimonadaceae bacterium]